MIQLVHSFRTFKPARGPLTPSSPAAGPVLGPADPGSATKGHGAPYLGYVHSLRGLAILTVVAVHVADAEGWGGVDAGPLQHSLWGLFGTPQCPSFSCRGFCFSTSRRASPIVAIWPSA